MCFLCIGLSFKCFTSICIFHSQENDIKWVLLYPHFTNEKTNFVSVKKPWTSHPCSHPLLIQSLSHSTGMCWVFADVPGTMLALRVQWSSKQVTPGLLEASVGREEQGINMEAQVEVIAIKRNYRVHWGALKGPFLRQDSQQRSLCESDN